MSELPPANQNIPPSPDWIDNETVLIADGLDEISLDQTRWMVLRTGEEVMWGEGELTIDVERARKAGHRMEEYVVVVGGPVGRASDEVFRVETPDGECVGFVWGAVSHKMNSAMSPDLRAVSVSDSDERAELLDAYARD